MCLKHLYKDSGSRKHLNPFEKQFINTYTKRCLPSEAKSVMAQNIMIGIHINLSSMALFLIPQYHKPNCIKLLSKLWIGNHYIKQTELYET